MKIIIKLVVAALVVVALGVALLAIYAHVHGQPGAKVSDLVPNAVKAAVEPWNTRAEHVLQKMMQGVDGPSMALSCMKLTHPTGKNPQLSKFEVNPSGAGITASFEVSWQGDLTGKFYQTLVIWECTQQAHTKASVTEDTAPTAVTEKPQIQLDEYFRTEIYPVLCRDMK